MVPFVAWRGKSQAAMKANASVSVGASFVRSLQPPGRMIESPQFSIVEAGNLRIEGTKLTESASAFALCLGALVLAVELASCGSATLKTADGGAGGSAGSGNSGGTGGVGAAGGSVGRGGGAGTVAGAAGTAGTGGTGGNAGSAGSGNSGGKGGSVPPRDGSADSPDATCHPASTELCFNGIDDDCDGLADCADPTCASVAVCVPVGTAFSLGITVTAGSPCPIGFQVGTPTVINQGVTGDASCNGCTCSVASHCSTTLSAYPSTTACTGTPVVLASLDETSKCVSFPTSHAGLPHVDNFAYSATCSGGGAAVPSTWGWSTTMKFCPADPPGGGCKAGYACVHKSPTTYCEIGSGSCSAGFTAVTGGTWYTSATDNRACGSCGCTITAAGNCSKSDVLEHPANECAVTNPTSFVLPQGDRCDGFGETSEFTTADLSVTNTPSTCAGSTTMSGAVTPTGAETVCCQ